MSLGCLSDVGVLAGMTLFQRARDIVEAKANKTLAAAEKPNEMRDLSCEQMLDQIKRRRIDMGHRHGASP